MSDKLKVSKVESKGYGIIYKLPMQDKDLDVVAKAFYAYICSYAGAGDTAFPTMEKICSDLNISRQRLERHRKNLVEKGYISIRKIKNPNGTFKHNEYTINKELQPMLQNPPMDELTMDEPTMDNDTTNKNIFNNNIKDNNNSKDNKKNKAVQQVELNLDFEEFWKIYPRKEVKHKALESFLKAIKKHDLTSIMKGAYKYAELCRIQNTEPKFIAHPATFLNQERYLDDYDALITEYQNRRNGGYNNGWNERPNGKPSVKETFGVELEF